MQPKKIKFIFSSEVTTMLSLQASFSITFYISLVISFVNLNSASDSNSGLCSPYPCNQPPQPPSSTGYSPYGNPPPPPSSPSSPPPPPRSRCPPVPPAGCCDQPPQSTYYSPPYPYFYTPPYPYGTLGGGDQNGGGQGGAGGGATGAAVAYYASSSAPVYALMLVFYCAFVVF